MLVYDPRNGNCKPCTKSTVNGGVQLGNATNTIRILPVISNLGGKPTMNGSLELESQL